MAGIGSTLFSGGLFWRNFRFGGNWLHSILGRIVLEAAQIWRKLASHFFPADCFGGSSDLAGTGSTLFFRRIVSDGSSSDLAETGSTLFSGKLFRRRLRFGGNWLHSIFRLIVLEETQIWQELAPHYFRTDCFGGSSDFAGTCSTSFSGGLFWRQLRFGGN